MDGIIGIWVGRRLVGRLVGRLVSRLVGRLVDRLAGGWVYGWVGRLVGKTVDVEVVIVRLINDKTFPKTDHSTLGDLILQSCPPVADDGSGRLVKFSCSNNIEHHASMHDPLLMLSGHNERMIFLVVVASMVLNFLYFNQ